MSISSVVTSLRIYGFRTTIRRISARLSFFFVKYILKRDIAKKKIHGSKMWLDLKNKGISRALWLEGTREELDVEIVKSEIKPDMNILEIGANIGYYLLLEGKLLRGRGTIYAFEPDPRNISLLQRNISLNKLEEIVKFYPHAVSDINSRSKFYLAGFSNLSSMVQKTNSKEYIEVKTVRIDDFEEIKGNIDFVRMDIEGYEYEVLNGMMGTLEKSKPGILVELHPAAYGPERDFSKVAEKLFSLGYKIKYLVSAGTHSPKEITDKGYNPSEVIQELVHSHGLYENIKNEDFIEFIKNPTKIVRSVMFGAI